MEPHALFQKYLALALNPSTPEYEARNAAMGALRLVAEKKLIVVVPGPPIPGRVHPAGVDPEVLADIIFGRKDRPAAPQPAQAVDPDEQGSRRIVARFSSRCGRCGDVVGVGQSIFWHPSGAAPGRVHCVPCGPIR